MLSYAGWPARPDVFLFVRVASAPAAGWAANSGWPPSWRRLGALENRHHLRQKPQKTRVIARDRDP